MKRTTIVRIAEWTGWCGPCAAERPLVLTRTGRHTLRSWVVGSDSPERPLTLTCRLCGVGVVVPPEADDPEIEVGTVAVSAEVVVPAQAATEPHLQPQSGAEVLLAAAEPPRATRPVPAAEPLGATRPVPAPEPRGAADPVPAVRATSGAAPVAVVPPVATPVPLPASLAVADAASPQAAPALQAARQEMATALAALRCRRADEAPRPPAVLPQQRSGATPAVDGLQALQLLAEGLDLLSTHR